MLGLLVKQVALTPVDSPNRQTLIKILWHTGATSELLVNRPSIRQKLGTPQAVVQAIRELATGRTDAEIATELNQRGLVSGKGCAFTASSVAWIRLKYEINKPGSDPGFARSVGIRSDGWYSTSALAQKLGVGIHTIHYWQSSSLPPLHGGRVCARKGCCGSESRNGHWTLVASGNTRSPQDTMR